MPLLAGVGLAGQDLLRTAGPRGRAQPYPVVSPADRRAARRDGDGDRGGRQPGRGAGGRRAAGLGRRAVHRAGGGPAPGRRPVAPARGGDHRLADARDRLDRPVRRLPGDDLRAGVLRGVGPRVRAVRRAAALLPAAAEPGAAAARRRRRGDRAVQRADDPLHPRGGPGPRARQRGPAQARPAHRGQRRRRARPDLRRGGPARRVCCTSCPAAPTWARRSSSSGPCG